MKKLIIILLLMVILITCKQNTKKEIKEENKYIFIAPVTKEKLPNNLIWLTNNEDPEFSSPEAKKGGILRLSINSFPNTFRTVGPDSNNSFRDYILNNQLSLIALHPNTENLIPQLATHWAYDKDKKTMYFKLNPNAKWSDGVQVTAQDFAYTLEFMRSSYIVAPWYNDYYTEYIDKITIYDDYTLSVSATRPMPDLFLYTNISPTPRHYFGQLDNSFTQKYNWEIIPNTGAYQILTFVKGKYILFNRKKDWWAKDLKYYRNRFNVDQVKFTVISDLNMTYEYFKKGMLDTSGLTHPMYWHQKSNIDIFKNGYANKIWFYYDSRQSSWGIYLNQDKEIFKDINVRYAFAYAMNFDKINNELMRKEYYRLNHGFVGYGKYSNMDIEPKNYDIAKVEYYMTLSGWKRGSDGIWEKSGQKFSVELTYSNSPLDTERIVILKEEAKKAGIDLRLDSLDGATMYKKVMEKKHDIAWWAWSTGFRPEYWQHYHSINAHKPQTNNITNTDNSELDKLIDQYRKSIDESELIKLSIIIQKKIDELCVFIPAFMIPYVRQGYWRWWQLPENHGTKISSEGLFDPFESTIGGLFWFDEEIYKETKNAMKKGVKFEPVTLIDKTYIIKGIK